VSERRFRIIASEERVTGTVQVINGMRIKKEFCEWCGRLIRITRYSVPIASSYFEHDCPVGERVKK